MVKSCAVILLAVLRTSYNATIKSDNLNIAAVQDSKATQMKASHKGFLSSSVSIDIKATATNIASNLSANNL
jgi:hypothetical protein